MTVHSMERPLPLRNTIKTTPAAGDTEGREVDDMLNMLMTEAPKMPATGLQSRTYKSK